MKRILEENKCKEEIKKDKTEKRKRKKYGFSQENEDYLDQNTPRKVFSKEDKLNSIFFMGKSLNTKQFISQIKKFLNEKNVLLCL